MGNLQLRDIQCCIFGRYECPGLSKKGGAIF